MAGSRHKAAGRSRHAPYVQSRRRYRIDRTIPGELVELFAVGDGFAFVMPQVDAPPALLAYLPGGYVTGDLNGVDVVIPKETSEPITADELVALARAGRHGFRVVGAAKERGVA